MEGGNNVIVNKIIVTREKGTTLKDETKEMRDFSV